MPLIKFFAALALTSLLISAAPAVPTMAPATAAQLVAEGKAVLVDVREPAEWEESGVAQPAVLLPKSDFDGDQKLWKKFLAENGDKQVILYCRSGRRSEAVATALAERNVAVANAGSFKDWTDAGLPTKAWSKDRPQNE